MPVIVFPVLFLCLSSESLCSNVRLLCSCPQESVRSSAASAVPLSPRRATYCVTSSSTQGRNPSNVTCAAMPVAGGTPSPAIYAPTRVSMGSSPTQKTAGWKPLQKGIRRSAVHMRSVLYKGKLTGCRCGVTFFFLLMLCRSMC